MDGYNEDFWNALDELVSNSEIVIDRPRGSALNGRAFYYR